MTPRTLFSAALVSLALAPSIARAQVGPGTPGGAPAGPAGAEEEEKPEGVAEAAPKTPGLLPTTPSLPPAKGKRNRFELFELDGYFRFRGDFMKNFNLSFRDDPVEPHSNDGKELVYKEYTKTRNLYLYTAT